jgi:hypothetical protein
VQVQALEGCECGADTAAPSAVSASLLEGAERIIESDYAGGKRILTLSFWRTLPEPPASGNQDGGKSDGKTFPDEILRFFKMC